MPVLQQSSTNVATRQLPLRVRVDLHVRKHYYHGVPHWIVKDPVGMNYFRFHDEEYFLLRQLDGETSLADIQQKFEKRFAPRRLRIERLQQFIARLHASGLLLLDQPGQGKKLKTQADETAMRRRRAATANIFGIRFPGFDPDRLLTRLYPYVAWFYTTPCVLLVMTLAIVAFLSVIINLESFTARLPSASLFFGPENLHWLVLSMIFCKVLHEFGHGFACKHFGGECHQMGVMLLFFAPAMYCDVSDSWLLPSKWQRMAIGAGGMHVELFISAIATFAWWLSEPGLVNSICLSVMLLTSVSTVLVNANPLLRYDGYYILSDYLEMPNLAQRSRDLLRHYLIKWCFGIEFPTGKAVSRSGKIWLFTYAILSAIYRWFMVFGALWFLSQALDIYDLQVLGRMVAIFGLFALVVMPIWQTAKLLYIPGRLSQMKRGRIVITTAVAALAAGAFFFLPLPRSVVCPAIVRLQSAETIYAQVAGKLDVVKAPYGSVVEPGSVIAKLSNDELDYAIAELEGQANQLEAQLKGLEREQLVNPEAGRTIKSIAETLDKTKDQLAERMKDRQSLVRKAGRSGVVLPVAEVVRKRRLAEARQVRDGGPLEPHHLGTHLRPNEALCQVGDPKSLELVILIDQSEVEFVRVGASVTAWPASNPFDPVTSKIEEISNSGINTGPLSLAHKHGGHLATQMSTEGEKLLRATYQARANLDNSSQQIIPGLRCEVKVEAQPQTLAARLLRWIVETFEFRA